MADDDVKTEDKPVAPFAADGDSKVGEPAAEHEAAPDPAQPALQEADEAPVAVGPASVRDGYWGKQDATNPAFSLDRPNPVATEGTTEVSNEPAVGYQFADPNDPIRQRYAEMERKKEEDIAELVKMGDGRPKV